jgi:hypothetical protein
MGRYQNQTQGGALVFDKNKPGNSPRNQQIRWEVGIAPETDNVYIYFFNGEKHFRCEMDGDTPREIGNALVDAANKRSALMRGGDA